MMRLPLLCKVEQEGDKETELFLYVHSYMKGHNLGPQQFFCNHIDGAMYIQRHTCRLQLYTVTMYAHKYTYECIYTTRYTYVCVYVHTIVHDAKGRMMDGMEILNLTHCLWHAFHPSCPVLHVSVDSGIYRLRG